MRKLSRSAAQPVEARDRDLRCFVEILRSASNGASVALPEFETMSTLQLGSSNRDVTRLQELLNLAGATPRLRADGQFGPATDRAVRRFQSHHALTDDGIVGTRTWSALERAAHVNARTTPEQPPPADNGPVASTGEGFCFPFSFRTSPDWKGGARYFGARRDNGNRLHAGCDLLAPAGTTIYAIADGTLVRSPYYFYSNTYAVEVRHGPYLVRYGEIMGGSYIGGQHPRKGQPICKVGRLSSGSSMLHFEIYSNGASTAPLTTSHGPYKRRSDVFNASPLLDQWARNLPHAH